MVKNRFRSSPDSNQDCHFLHNQFCIVLFFWLFLNVWPTWTDVLHAHTNEKESFETRSKRAMLPRIIWRRGDKRGQIHSMNTIYSIECVYFSSEYMQITTIFWLRLLHLSSFCAVYDLPNVKYQMTSTLFTKQSLYNWILSPLSLFPALSVSDIRMSIKIFSLNRSHFHSSVYYTHTHNFNGLRTFFHRAIIITIV